MKSPPGRAIGYTAAVVVVLFVIWLVLFLIIGLIISPF